jgi:hypothetical protein
MTLRMTAMIGPNYCPHRGAAAWGLATILIEASVTLVQQCRRNMRDGTSGRKSRAPAPAARQDKTAGRDGTAPPTAIIREVKAGSYIVRYRDSRC